jgi:hypothetical protein
LEVIYLEVQVIFQIIFYFKIHENGIFKKYF